MFTQNRAGKDMAAKKVSGDTDSSLLIIIVCLSLIALTLVFAGVLIAEAMSAPDSLQPGFDLKAITDTDLAGKRLLDTGWPCGEPDRSCCHILINDSDSILCVPAELSDGLLTLPIEHFRLIAGCGLEITMDGKLKLTKDGRSNVLQADSRQLIRGDGILTLPVVPYKVYGYTFVPLRFLCEVLGIEILWHDEGDTVLLSSPGVDPGSILTYMRTINASLMKAIKEFEGPYGEPLELVVSFYYSSRKSVYTASGYPAQAGTIAADISIPFGTRFHIPELSFISQDGVFTVKDRGRRVTGNNIDIFIPNSLRDDPDVSAAIRRGRFSVTGYILRPDS